MAMTQFEHAIKAYLDDRAEKDSLFAQSYANEKKTIHECCKFIEAEVCDRVKNKKGAQSLGMTNEEVYGLAVHYYDEADIKIKPISAANCKVVHTGPVVNYKPTAEKMEEARKAALKRIEDEAYEKLHSPKKKKTAEVSTEQPAGTGTQTSLFDLMQ